MFSAETLQQIYDLSDDYEVRLKHHMILKSGTHCLLFANYCPSTLFYKDFLKVTSSIFHVKYETTKLLRHIKRLLKAQGCHPIRCRGVFSFYGDLRPLAKAAGWGDYGKEGIIVNDQLGSDFLITAVFFNV